MRTRRTVCSVVMLATMLSAGGAALADPPPTRADVVRALSGFEHVPSPEAIRAWGEPGVTALMDLASDPATPRHVRVRAVYALRLFPTHAGVPAMLRTVASDSTAHAIVRRAAIDAIAEGLGDVTEVAHHLVDGDLDVRDGAAWALSRLNTHEARAAMRAALQTETHEAIRLTLQQGLR